jgi:hypothetical protein
MHFPLEAFPDIVVQLQQLEYLELYTSTLKTLPISLLNINTLKKLVIYNEEPIGLPSAFKILETRLEQFDFKKGFYYQP